MQRKLLSIRSYPFVNILRIPNINSKFMVLSLYFIGCTPGHFCVTGSKQQEPCPSGTYQDKFGQANCSVCPQRYYCNGNIQNDTHCTHGVQLPSLCHQGYFCSAGSKTGYENPCPNGESNLCKIMAFRII